MPLLPNMAFYFQYFSWMSEGNKSFALILGMHNRDMSKMLEELGNIIFHPIFFVVDCTGMISFSHWHCWMNSLQKGILVSIVTVRYGQAWKFVPCQVRVFSSVEKKILSFQLGFPKYLLFPKFSQQDSRYSHTQTKGYMMKYLTCKNFIKIINGKSICGICAETAARVLPSSWC